MVYDWTVEECAAWFLRQGIPVPTPSGCFDYEDFADYAYDTSWWQERVLDYMEEAHQCQSFREQ